MKELTEIANCCGTDKGSVKDEAHGFTEFCDSIFREYRECAVKIGGDINNGSWENYIDGALSEEEKKDYLEIESFYK